MGIRLTSRPDFVETTLRSQVHQFDTVEDLRAGADDRLRAELGCVDVVLLIDGYGQLGTEFEGLEANVHDLLTRGGPGDTTEILVTYAYRISFVNSPRDYAGASAWGVLILLILLLFAVVYRRALRRQGEV